MQTSFCAQNRSKAYVKNMINAEFVARVSIKNFRRNRKSRGVIFQGIERVGEQKGAGEKYQKALKSWGSISEAP